MYRKGSLFDHENSILAANSESGVSRVEYDNDNYKIHVNVKDFRPEELVVKTVDNTVKVKKILVYCQILSVIASSESCDCYLNYLDITSVCLFIRKTICFNQ